MEELLLGPIVGGLSFSSANLWGRASSDGLLHAWVGSKPDLSDAKMAGQSLPLVKENGFAGVVPLVDLSPKTHYYYTLTLNETPPDPTKGPYPEFSTFPPPGQKESFAFAFGSCFLPEGEDEGEIFQALEKRRISDNLQFVLLIGDQIYADAYNNNGIGKIASSLNDYRAVYTYAWKRPPLRNLLANLPAFMTLDDHEVDDDWCWSDSQRQHPKIPFWNKIKRRLRGMEPSELSLPRVQNALKAYWEHQGMHAPAFLKTPDFDQIGLYTLADKDPGSLAYTFAFGATAFFVMDTRTRRVRSRNRKTVLGDEQWELLETWLLSVKEEYPIKFLVTSSGLLTSLWVDIIYDRWGAFHSERKRLINFLADNAIDGVHLLSGDLHSAHAVSGYLKSRDGKQIRLWEFCSTPFKQEPNWISKYTFDSRPYGKIRQLQRHFSLAEANFGIIRVDFSEEEKPLVNFGVYGNNGQLLKSINTG